MTRTRKPVVTRPDLSREDGMAQGGLAFCITAIAGMIAAASLVAGALTSFWVWFVLLMMAISVAAAARPFFASPKGQKE